VNRKFRLTKSTDYLRVRRSGRSFAHPLVVLVILPNDRGETRFAISAGRSLGSAVKRNHAKRMLREIIRPLLPDIVPGWDVVILARKPMAEASFQEIRKALHLLLNHSQLLRVLDGTGS
jgi:ribonuclease P protein component